MQVLFSYTEGNSSLGGIFMTNNFLKAVAGGLIVSCQALENEPLHGSHIMAKMALAAKQAGAVGIRANSVSDICAIKQAVSLPLIGIIKKDYPDSKVYITPTLAEMRQVAHTKVEVVACQVTNQPRPHNEDLQTSLRAFRQEFPNTLLMADTGDLADVKLASKLGFDIIGTTMHGYTPTTQNANIANNDFAYLKEVLATTELPVIAEGKIDTPAKAKRVLELGAHAVVVGGAITRPQEIAQRFVDRIKASH